MPDREKVIKGLECCLAWPKRGPERCAECPYAVSDHFVCFPDDLLADAISLIREQEPVKPYRGDRWPKDAYCCGHCAQALVDTGKNNRPKYCPQCGRKVKWDDVRNHTD